MNGLGVFLLISHLSVLLTEQAIPISDPVRNNEMLLEFYALWKHSFSGMHPDQIESAAWMIKTEQGTSFKKWGRLFEPNIQRWSGRIPTNAIALAHTHSRKVRPTPSKVDCAASRDLRIPIYVVSHVGIWRVMPDGTIVQDEGPKWWKTFSEIRISTNSAVPH
jgi:hypothetical protein